MKASEEKPKKIDRRLWKIMEVTVWLSVAVCIGLFVYVNYYLPHGPSYPTGEYVCNSEQGGPCGPEYKEDLRNVDIPGWAKFVRNGSEMFLILMVLVMVGIYLSNEEIKETRTRNKNDN